MDRKTSLSAQSSYVAGSLASSIAKKAKRGPNPSVTKRIGLQLGITQVIAGLLVPVPVFLTTLTFEGSVPLWETLAPLVINPPLVTGLFALVGPIGAKLFPTHLTRVHNLMILLVSAFPWLFLVWAALNPSHSWSTSTGSPGISGSGIESSIDFITSKSFTSIKAIGCLAYQGLLSSSSTEWDLGSHFCTDTDLPSEPLETFHKLPTSPAFRVLPPSVFTTAIWSISAAGFFCLASWYLVSVTLLSAGYATRKPTRSTSTSTSTTSPSQPATPVTSRPSTPSSGCSSPRPEAMDGKTAMASPRSLDKPQHAGLRRLSASAPVNMVKTMLKSASSNLSAMIHGRNAAHSLHPFFAEHFPATQNSSFPRPLVWLEAVGGLILAGIIFQGIPIGGMKLLLDLDDLAAKHNVRVSEEAIPFYIFALSFAGFLNPIVNFYSIISTTRAIDLESKKRYYDQSAALFAISNTLIGVSSDLFAIVDPDLNLVSANASFFQVIPRAKPEEPMIPCLSPDDQEPVRAFLSRAPNKDVRRNGPEITIRDGGDDQVNIRAGRRFQLYSVSFSVPNVGFETELFTLLSLRDVTAQADNQFARAAEAKAIEESVAKGQLLANMSHEIRTPLHGIMGMTQLLMDTPLTRLQAEYCSTVLNLADGFLTILNDILDFSKISAGRMTLESIPFNLQELIEETCLFVAPNAFNKDIELVSFIEPSLPSIIVGDAVRTRQIILNLVTNAIKFTSSGHVVVSAGAVAEFIDGWMIRVRVADSGVGLTEAEATKLFEPFKQANEATTRKFGGTGLGLAISKQLSRLMGGDIGIYTHYTNGACFWFTIMVGKHIPRDRGSETHMPSSKPRPHSVQAYSSGAGGSSSAGSLPQASSTSTPRCERLTRLVPASIKSADGQTVASTISDGVAVQTPSSGLVQPATIAPDSMEAYHRALVVDESPEVRAVLSQYLLQAGYSADESSHLDECVTETLVQSSSTSRPISVLIVTVPSLSSLMSGPEPSSSSKLAGLFDPPETGVRKSGLQPWSSAPSGSFPTLDMPTPESTPRATQSSRLTPRGYRDDEQDGSNGSGDSDDGNDTMEDDDDVLTDLVSMSDAPFTSEEAPAVSKKSRIRTWTRRMSRPSRKKSASVGGGSVMAKELQLNLSSITSGGNGRIKSRRSRKSFHVSSLSNHPESPVNGPTTPTMTSFGPSALSSGPSMESQSGLSTASGASGFSNSTMSSTSAFDGSSSQSGGGSSALRQVLLGIQNHPRLAELRIILVSRVRSEVDTLRVRQSGLRHVVWKPVRQEQLLAELPTEEEMMDQHRARVSAEIGAGASPRKKLSGSIGKSGAWIPTRLLSTGGPRRVSVTAVGSTGSDKLIGGTVGVASGNRRGKQVSRDGTHLATYSDPADRKSIKILLAEDNMVLRKMAQRMVTQMGYTITTAPNGQEAVDTLFSQVADGSTHGFQLMLMDCEMPIMNGFEATEAIRKKEAELGIKAAVPIVALTANGLASDIERCLNVGMDDYLAKPFRQQQLSEYIEKWTDPSTFEEARDRSKSALKSKFRTWTGRNMTG